jgi:hypothetical protein
MNPDAALTELTHVIELAVAPVFLLMALGTMLNVFSGRLARTVDRARLLLARNPSPAPEGKPGLDPSVQFELEALYHRRRLINYAITSATVAALLVCILIVMVFVGFMADVRFPQIIAGLFIATMGAFILALVFFLREIGLAVRTTAFR